jgi:hypothetical protein
MTPSEEVRLLSALLERIEGGKRTSRRARRFAIVNWLLLVVAFIALFDVGPRVGSIVYIVAGVASVLGILTSYVVIQRRSLQQWPVLAPFIRADEVRRRIIELKPDNSPERPREG